jgi:hypothetical protein
MTDTYVCPYCHGTGHPPLTPALQETLDACRRLRSKGVTLTARAILKEQPHLIFSQLSGRLGNLRKRGYLEMTDRVHGGVQGTTFIYTLIERKK